MVEIAMKVLFVSRIGLSEGDLDKYMKDFIGVHFNLSKWKNFFFTLVDSLFVRNGRYMYFHQLLLETVHQRFFQQGFTLKESQSEYGMWLLGQYSDQDECKEELVAEICYQLINGECYDALVEYLKNEHVVESMLGGRYRYEFFNCWRKIHEKGVGNYKDAYANLIKSMSRAGSMLVEFFLEAYENAFLVAILPQRLAKRIDEESKASDYLTIGRVYKNLQNWPASLEYLKRCLEINVYLGSIDDYVAALHDEIGEIELHQDSVENAMSNFQNSFDIRVKLFGETSLQVASSLDQFGKVSLQKKSFARAREFFQHAMEIRFKIVGQDHPLIATSLSNNARVDLVEQNYAQGIDSLKKAHSIWSCALGPKHPSVATALTEIAHFYEAQKSYKDASMVLDQAMSAFLDSVGENHPMAISTLDKLADLEHLLKNFTKSLELYTKVLEIQKRTLGDRHILVAKALENIGRTNFELKRFDQVHEYMNPACAIRQSSRSESSISDYAQSIRIAELMVQYKEYESAVHLYEKAISILLTTGNIKQGVAWAACERVAHILQISGKNNQIVDFWVNMKIRLEKQLGWSDELTLLCCENVAHASKRIGIEKEPIEFSDVHNFICQQFQGSIGNQIFSIEEIVSKLFSIVYSSRLDQGKSKAASIAVSLLNFINISFTGLDLSNISIPKANLSGANLDGALLVGVDLSGAVLENANLGSCKFDKAIMEGIKFGAPLSALQGHQDWVRTVCVFDGANGERFVASGSEDKSIRIWSVSVGALVKVLSGHSDWIHSLCIARQANGDLWLVSASSDQTIRVWDVQTFTEVRVLQGHSGWVHSVCSFKGSDANPLLASGGADKTIRIWDLSTGTELKVLNGHLSVVSSLCTVMSPSGECWIASGSADNTVRLWDPIQGVELFVLNGHTNYVHGVCSVKGPKDEWWLASASYDKTVRVWDIETQREQHVYWGHSDFVRTVCSVKGPNGECWLASGSGDKTIRVWDLATGLQIKLFEGHTDNVCSVASLLGPYEECLLVSGSADKSLRLWRLDLNLGVNNGRLSRKPVCKVFRALGLNEEEFILTLGDHRVSLWDLKTGDLIVSLHRDEVFLSPNDGLLMKKEEKEILAKLPCSGKMPRFSLVDEADSNEELISTRDRLVGGDIQMVGVREIGKVEKAVLLRLGGVSMDQDFVDYCEAGTFTRYQAKAMAQCYTDGVVVESNLQKVQEWQQKSTLLTE
eukprot:TRINITY_DN4235_c0_g1_i3.p1 TRINITY_DN4235_c0_g1~~TRINITY_DN4235_c0_g1_i3.p1  ORF type:complete len:1285 (-),score=233.19 TRINITY_DN4235_c0_g1_i3:151-3810(-)